MLVASKIATPEDVGETGGTPDVQCLERKSKEGQSCYDVPSATEWSSGRFQAEAFAFEEGELVAFQRDALVQASFASISQTLHNHMCVHMYTYICIHTLHVCACVHFFDGSVCLSLCVCVEVHLPGLGRPGQFFDGQSSLSQESTAVTAVSHHLPEASEPVIKTPA